MRVGHNLLQKQIKCIIDVCNLLCISVSLLALRHSCICTHTLKSRGSTAVSVKRWIWRWLFLINDLCAPPQSDRWALTLSTAALILLSSAVLSRTGRLAEWNKLIFSPPTPLPFYPSLWSSILNLTNFIRPLPSGLASLYLEYDLLKNHHLLRIYEYYRRCLSQQTTCKYTSLLKLI